jgi:hypothetical protein
MTIAKPAVFLCISLAGPLVATADSADSDITVKDIGNGQYELTLRTTTTVNILEAQHELVPTARKTCAEKELHYGHYAFAANQPLNGPAKASTLTFTQTIRCGFETPPAIPQTTSAPDDWKPSATDQSEIESQTYAYYRAKDAGDYAAAYAMFDRSMKETMTFDVFTVNAKSQSAKAGHILNRLVIKITWYKDPPSAPEPGIYAAADFAGQFENDPIYCGYLGWHRGADGKYRITREEENLIHKSTVAQLSQTELNALATKLGCPISQ